MTPLTRSGIIAIVTLICAWFYNRISLKDFLDTLYWKLYCEPPKVCGSFFVETWLLSYLIPFIFTPTIIGVVAGLLSKQDKYRHGMTAWLVSFLTMVLFAVIMALAV